MQDLGKLFDTSDFPARWQCGDWSTLHGWIHVGADLATWGAYFAIPCVLAYFISRRRDIPFTSIFWLFCAFILACGTTHLIEATIFWHPWYRLSALAKVVTAAVSWVTVFALVPVIPRALALPGLAAVNARLEEEVRERRRAEALLSERNEELDEFAHAASHDLKAPLRAINHLARFAIEDAGDDLPPKAREHLDLLTARTRRMATLLDDLLDYSRVGRQAALCESIDTAALVREIVDLNGLPPGFRLEVGDLPSTISPIAPLAKVFRNLLGNALKHHDRAEGVLRVSGTREGDLLRFVVEDDGPGIDPAHAERIFRVFTTLRPIDEVEGSGMGLAIVRKSVERMGGEVALVPREGRGARFEFTWPVDARPSPEQPWAPPEPGRMTTPGLAPS